MKIGIASDHGGFQLKQTLIPFLKEKGFEVMDFGNLVEDAQDDFPDFIVPLAKAVADKLVVKGIAICGSGVGAAVVANKIKGVRAALINDSFSAHQGVEDDDMNVMCLGGRVTGFASAEEYLMGFLNAKFIGAERHLRRLKKIQETENAMR
jgi:ribose 5-phosphate isomerase B